MTIDLIIENGDVITEYGRVRTDIAINDGKIVGLGNKGAFSDASRVVNANGKLVIPGGIDPHTHIEGYFMGAEVPEDYETATSAAAIGGTTTVLDFAGLERPEPNDTILDMVDKKMARAKKLSVIDYSVKPMLKNAFYTDKSSLEKIINELVGRGIPGFKVFMAYKDQDIYTDDWKLYQIMDTVKNTDAVLQIHAENGMLEDGMRKALIEGGHKEPIYHAISKPNIVENLAIETAMRIALETGTYTYIVHQSTMEGPEIVHLYRSAGAVAFEETCPQYLTLTEDYLKEKGRGRYYICSPPLRTKEDVDALWSFIANGWVHTVGSDHLAFSVEQKEMFDEFNKVPNGLPGIETRLPLVFSEGVMKRGLSIKRFVEVVSTNAAKIFGLYPRKGVIAIGSDADLVVIDPSKEHSLNATDLHMGTDLSVFSHLKTKGWPVMTVSKGKIIAENDQFIGKRGEGQFLKGHPNRDFLLSIQ